MGDAVKKIVDEKKVKDLAEELKFNLQEEDIKDAVSYINGLGEFLEPILETKVDSKEDRTEQLDLMESFEEASLREDVPKESEIHPEDNAPAFDFNHFVVPLVK